MQVAKSFYTTFTHEFDVKGVEDVSCNFCRAAEFRLVCVESSFEVRTCLGCGLVYVSPQPTVEELPEFYDGMYADTSDAEMTARSMGAMEGHLKRIIRRRMPDGGRFLEVGCGNGRLLKTIADLPLELTAIELSESAADYARRAVPRAAIRNLGIDSAEFPPGSQDCVALIAVLEHVKDPRAVLTKLCGWLAPGGTIIIQVPYVQHFIRLKRWLPWLPVFFEAPRHLFDFSPRLLRGYLTELGFTDIRIEIARPYSSNGPIGTALIWVVKGIGLAIYAVTGGHYIYPFAAATTTHAKLPA